MSRVPALLVLPLATAFWGFIGTSPNAETGSERAANSHPARPTAATPLILAASTQGETAIGPGDLVVVIADAAELKMGRQLRAVLVKGTHFLVTEIDGKWIGGRAIVGGRMTQGWIPRDAAELRERIIEEPPASAVEERAMPAVEEPSVSTVEKPPATTVEKPPASAVEKSPEPPVAKPTGVAAGGREALSFRISVLRDDAELKTIDRSRDIRRLILTGDGVTDAALKQLDGLNVRALSIEGTQITNAGLQHLRALANLKSLRLWAHQFTNASLEHVKNLTSLEALDLDGTETQGSGLRHLADLPKLQTLVLGPAVRDVDLEYLQDLASLQEVDLRACRQISDAGMAHIDTLSKLRAVWLPRQVTDDGRNRLRQKLPNCEFRW